MSPESQTSSVIAKEITISVIQNMDLSHSVQTDKIGEYVVNLYKTIFKGINAE
jgi:hypothetical protein